MASVPYQRSLKISKRVWHPCHILFIYPLPMGAWVWQDAIPSYLSLTDGCVGMAGMPYPPIYNLQLNQFLYLHIETMTNPIKNNLFSVYEHTLFDLYQ